MAMIDNTNSLINKNNEENPIIEKQQFQNLQVIKKEDENLEIIISLSDEKLEEQHLDTLKTTITTTALSSIELLFNMDSKNNISSVSNQIATRTTINNHTDIQINDTVSINTRKNFSAQAKNLKKETTILNHRRKNNYRNRLLPTDDYITQSPPPENSIFFSYKKIFKENIYFI